MGAGSGGGDLGFLRGCLREYTLISDAHLDLGGAEGVAEAATGAGPAAASCPPSALPGGVDAMHKP